MPAFETLNPAAVEAVIRMADLAADDDALLDALAADELARRRPDPVGPIDWRDPPPAALGRRVLRLAIGDPAPTADRIEALLDGGERTARRPASWSLAGGGRPKFGTGGSSSVCKPIGLAQLSPFVDARGRPYTLGPPSPRAVEPCRRP